ncbi:hypothetical protein AE07_02106 [Enterobacter cloacae BWH 43]|nr:hypothetical protein AE07_02106 [Enterobacter cloacae BWH 43]
MSLVRVQSEEPNLKSLLLKQAFCFSASLMLIQNRIQPGKHLIYNIIRYAFQPFAAPGSHINGSGLVEANSAHRFCSRTVQGDGKTVCTCKVSAAGLSIMDNHPAQAGNVCFSRYRDVLINGEQVTLAKN